MTATFNVHLSVMFVLFQIQLCYDNIMSSRSNVLANRYSAATMWITLLLCHNGTKHACGLAYCSIILVGSYCISFVKNTLRIITFPHISTSNCVGLL